MALIKIIDPKTIPILKINKILTNIFRYPALESGLNSSILGSYSVPVSLF